MLPRLPCRGAPAAVLRYSHYLLTQKAMSMRPRHNCSTWSSPEGHSAAPLSRLLTIGPLWNAISLRPSLVIRVRLGQESGSGLVGLARSPVQVWPAWLHRIAFRFGSDLVQILFRIGSELVQHWFRICSDLVQVWFRFGSDLVQVWFRSGRSGSGLIGLAASNWTQI